MNEVQAQSEQRSKRPATASRHLDLYARLLDAAEAAILADGLANLRARALAEAAGCSVGAIYGVFADLDALILAVGGRTLDAIEAAMRAAAPGCPADERLSCQAVAYLDYAAANLNRWRALFEHRMSAGQPVPAWYVARQSAAFAQIEAPLAALLPGRPAAEHMILARTVFSAVHGIVELGLSEKVVEMPIETLRQQLRLVVAAIAVGLPKTES